MKKQQNFFLNSLKFLNKFGILKNKLINFSKKMIFFKAVHEYFELFSPCYSP